MNLNDMDLTKAVEIKTKKTYDSWGHEGVCTYYRLTHWSNAEGYWSKYWANVYCSDTSSGHGWAGRMNQEEWDNIK